MSAMSVKGCKLLATCSVFNERGFCIASQCTRIRLLQPLQCAQCNSTQQPHKHQSPIALGALKLATGPEVVQIAPASGATGPKACRTACCAMFTAYMYVKRKGSRPKGPESVPGAPVVAAIGPTACRTACGAILMICSYYACNVQEGLGQQALRAAVPRLHLLSACM